MTPVMCRVKHDPPTSYGDCLRACIATVMDVDAEKVPHFADLGASGEETLAHARRWLGERGLTIFTSGFPGDLPLADVLTYMGQVNGSVTWLLFGSTGVDGRDLHVNVCQGGQVVHDPAWVQSSIKSPCILDGVPVWQIWVIART